MKLRLSSPPPTLRIFAGHLECFAVHGGFDVEVYDSVIRE